MKLDRNVPLPPKHARTKWPFPQMVKGDSFFMPKVDARNWNCAHAWARKHPGYKFATRSVTESDVKGTRVWCVESPATSVKDLTVSRVHYMDKR